MKSSAFTLKWTALSISLSAALLGACSTPPIGPSVAVMPAVGKPFDLFVEEDKVCRLFAQNSTGKTAEEAQVSDTAKSVAIGVALGALVGVSGGGDSKGAGQGAAMGGLGGAMMGGAAGNQSARDFQRRYDIAYQQCMYAKGNQIPGHPSHNVMPPVPPRNP